MKYYSLLILIAVCFQVTAQEQPGLEKIADKHFVKYEYALAAPLYERLLDKRRVKKDWMYKAAFSYESMHQYERAVHWYSRLLHTDTSVRPDLILHAADLMKTLQQTDTAIYWYERYRMKGGDSLKAQQRIFGTLLAKKWQQNPTKHILQNFREVNTALSDWGPFLYKDELVYVSEQKRKITGAYDNNPRHYTWNDNPYLTIQVTNHLKQGALIHEIIEKINDHDYHVGPAIFTKKLDTLYYTRTYRKANGHYEKPFKRFRVATRRLEIMYMFRTGLNTWSKPQSLIKDKGTVFSVGHVALSPLGDTMYFASDMPGGFGQTDIWYCVKTENNTWSEPRNCGATINTSDEEAFPVIDPFTGDLYFSSTGHIGMGGFDIFTTRRTDSTWSEPKNLYYPVNTSYDDFYFVVKNGYEMYLSSNRPDGKGSDDIYKIQIPVPKVDTVRSVQPVLPKTFVIKTVVLDKQTKQPIPLAGVQLTDMLSDQKQTTSANDHGIAYQQVPCNSHYRIRASKENYLSDSTGLLFPDCGLSDTMEVVMLLEPPVIKKQPEPVIPKRVSRFKVGDTFVLKDLYYDLDKYNIRPDAAKVLDSLITILNEYPEIDIELSSHTDSRASDAYNDRLSQNRAQSAVNYLVAHGIDKKRLQAKGYGEKKLRNHCADGVKCPEPLHQLNRRTEVRITNVRPID